MSSEQSARIMHRLVSVRKCAQKGSEFEGLVPQESLERLLSAVDECEAVSASVGFSIGESGKPEIQIAASAKVTMSCQRCLQPVTLELDASAQLVVVKHEEEARNRLAEIDPIVLQDEEVDLHAMVEQELSLVLPVIAKHEGDELAGCKAHVLASLNAGDQNNVGDQDSLGLDEVSHDQSGDGQLVTLEGENTAGIPTKRPFAGLDVLLAEQVDRSSNKN